MLVSLAHRHLVLDLEADEQEEQRHEDVVDDVRDAHRTYVVSPMAKPTSRWLNSSSTWCAAVWRALSAAMAARSMMPAALVAECVNATIFL